MPVSGFSDQKFLVVMVKDGGEDSFHTLLSRDTGHVAAAIRARPQLAFTQSELDSTFASCRLEGTSFSVHPALRALTGAWVAGDMAVTHRVGTMFTNIATTPIEELRQARSGHYTGPILYPSGIGAHDKQKFGSSSMITRDFLDSSGRAYTVESSGFLGRLTNRFAGYTGSSSIPMAITSGERVVTIDFLGMHGTTTPLRVPHAGIRFDRNFARATIQDRALIRLDSVMNEPKSDPRMEGFRQANILMNTSVSFFQPVIEQAMGRFSVDADFGTSHQRGWQGTMHTFARTIEAHLRNPTLHRRTVFIGGRTSYDTHSAQGKVEGNLPRLHAEWASAVMSFRAAMIRLGIWNNVVVVDHSEFSRTFHTGGSDGTEHGYARDAFIFGGSVRGRGKGGSTGLFGTYPTLLSGTGTGSHDISGGTLVPGVSLEQYWEDILRWFGADDSDIFAALPRRANFGPAVNLLV